jgi:hypothetical protein
VPDPTPFLSTVAGASATLVAIVGGLLVARFVSLDSEQQGAQQLLEEAQGRLDTAQERADEARRRLREWDQNDFLDQDVMEAIEAGELDIGELRKIGHDSPLDDDDLTPLVYLVAEEFARARQALAGLFVGDEDAPEGWKEFKRLWADAPTIRWDRPWQMVYNQLVHDARARRPQPMISNKFLYSSPPPPAVTTTGTLPEFFIHKLQRRDALQSAVDRAEQHIEDLEAEVGQLRRARDAVVQPKGLGGGLAVLAVFTIVGVLVPLWLLSRAPKRLTAHLGEVVFWLFFAGLVVLLLYMTRLALRLSGRWKAIAHAEAKERRDTVEKQEISDLSAASAADK